MTSDLISICIPTYNGEAFIKACLESCLQQSYPNYEVVVCDDGSTDKTVEIIQSYAAKHPKIKLICNHRNLGLVGNWNNCIQQSNGKWIKYVFQDDFISANCLELFAAQIKSDTRLIVCKRHFVFEETPSEKEKAYYASKSKTFDGLSSNNIIFASSIVHMATANISINFIAEPSFTLFRKDVVDELGFFDADFQQVCDLEFFQRIAVNYGLSYIPETACSFRIHKRSATSSNVSGKTYILKYLEPLVLLNKMMSDASYEKFRKALTTNERSLIRFYESTRLLEAQNEAKHNPENQKTFDLYSEKFPFLKATIKNRWWYSLILQAVKLKRKLN